MFQIESYFKTQKFITVGEVSIIVGAFLRVSLLPHLSHLPWCLCDLLISPKINPIRSTAGVLSPQNAHLAVILLTALFVFSSCLHSCLPSYQIVFVGVCRPHVCLSLVPFMCLFLFAFVTALSLLSLSLSSPFPCL